MGLFSRMDDKTAANGEMTLLLKYRGMREVMHDRGAMRRRLQGLGIARTAQHAADAHERLFDAEWEVSPARGVMEKREIRRGAEMMCISQWLDTLGSEAYGAFLEELKRRGRP